MNHVHEPVGVEQFDVDQSFVAFAFLGVELGGAGEFENLAELRELLGAGLDAVLVGVAVPFFATVVGDFLARFALVLAIDQHGGRVDNALADCVRASALGVRAAQQSFVGIAFIVQRDGRVGLAQVVGGDAADGRAENFGGQLAVIFADELLAAGGLLGTQSVGVGQRVAKFGVHLVEASAVNPAGVVAAAGQNAEAFVNGADAFRVEGRGLRVEGARRDACRTRRRDAYATGTLGDDPVGFGARGSLGSEVPEVGDFAEEIKLADVDAFALAFEADFGAVHVVEGVWASRFAKTKTMPR